MSPTDKIAVIGHNGWAARSIIRALASQPFTQPVRVLAREGSNTDALPDNTEVARYSWEDETTVRNALEGVDVLLYFNILILYLIVPANAQQLFHRPRWHIGPKEVDPTHERRQDKAIRAVRSGASVYC